MFHEIIDYLSIDISRIAVHVFYIENIACLNGLVVAMLLTFYRYLPYTSLTVKKKQCLSPIFRILKLKENIMF